MNEIKPQEENKSSREVFTDFFSEIIGYDRGIYRTLVDLRKQPRVVVENYLAKTNNYVSPFKILISIVTVWLLVNNLILDWYKIFGTFMTSYTTFLSGSDPVTPALLKFSKMSTKIGGDLFSKFYMGFVIFGTPLWAYFSYQFCKPFKIDFRMHLAVVGYHFSLGFIPAFIFIGCMIISFWLALAVSLIAIISPIIGLRVIYNKIFVLVPVSLFFEKNGLAIEKKYFRARLLTTYILLLIYALLCWAYYSMYPI